MIVPGYFLPESFTAAEVASLDFGRVQVQVPVLTPALTGEVIGSITRARDRYLATLPIHAILGVIDRAVARWLDPEYPLREMAKTALPEVTGLSQPMIASTLPKMLEGYRRDRLLRLLEDELGDPLVLDGFRPRAGGYSRVFGPKLITHVFSGNIPALAVPGLISALLVKSASLAKASSEEPIFPALFARSLAEEDPRLGECLAVLWWKGGDEALEEIVFSRADVVVAYGTDRAMESIRTQVKGRFIRHGHKLSFGIIGREALSNAEQVAQDAAYDVSLFDQQGCLSPHLFYVEEGGAISPEGFAHALTNAMEVLEQRLPRGRISREEALKVLQLRGAYEFKEIAGKGVIVYAGEGMAWTVIYEEDPTFLPSCLNRTVRVKPVKDIFEVLDLVAPFRPYLSTAGLAVSPDRLVPLADGLGRLGVSRICPIGRMQHPPISWHHDGRFQILDLLRWVDLELDTGCWMLDASLPSSSPTSNI